MNHRQCFRTLYFNDVIVVGSEFVMVIFKVSVTRIKQKNTKYYYQSFIAP